MFLSDSIPWPLHQATAVVFQATAVVVVYPIKFSLLVEAEKALLNVSSYHFKRRYRSVIFVIWLLNQFLKRNHIQQNDLVLTSFLSLNYKFETEENLCFLDRRNQS